MISIQIDNIVYATNKNLTGFFLRRESSGAYTQEDGNSQIGFTNVSEFEKYARARHIAPQYFGEKYPSVTNTGRFVWRKVQY